MTRLALIFIVLMTLSACTTLRNPNSVHEAAKVGSSDVRPASHSKAMAEQLPCFPALSALDRLAFQHAGTLRGNRIPTMPWLRHNRLITHVIKVEANHQNINKLLLRMSALAHQGLTHELAVVPRSQVEQWQRRYQVNTPTDAFIKRCSAQLIQSQHKQPKQTLLRLKAIPPDNDYSTLARIAGLYPLATVPFRLGVVKEQRQLAKEWGQVNDKRWVKYAPDLPLGSQAGSSTWDMLKRHAPTWLVNSTTRANLPGAPFWQGDQLQVNTQASTYAFVSEARWKQQRLTQLNYIIWFAERPRLKRLDWVAGQHDAVVFRVNLDPLGKVVAYDSIHLCGCWYRLFLPEGRPFQRSKRYWQEPVLMQRVNLPSQSNPSMAIYLQADTHQIQYIQPSANVSEAVHEMVSARSYSLKPFSQLLALPAASGVRPVFNQKGYVPGSERPERWLFWPMGVRNPGALRRFGDHAISFVGRRYFDDPRLLEKVSGLTSDL